MKEQDLPYGMKIVGFSSLEEILDYLESEERRAIDRTLDEQWRIGWDSYVFRMVEDLAIFGHVFGEQEFLDLNTEPGQEPDEETRDELDGLRAQYLAGYRYGIWYSAVEPQGEYGSAHVSTLWLITAEEFERAKQNDWKIWTELAIKLGQELYAAKQRINHETEGSDEEHR